ELADFLRGEIEAGRITMATHIAHVTPYILLYQDVVLFSVYTGINDDLYVAGYVFDRSVAGGRFRPAEEVNDRITNRPPPYLLLHELTANGTKLYDKLPELPPELLNGYEEVFNQKGVRLLRRTAASSGQLQADR